MKQQYLDLRLQGEARVRSSTLLINERLLRPLRQACSGGKMGEGPGAIGDGASNNSSSSSSSNNSSSSRGVASAVVMESKLEALIRHLERIKSSDPTSKCLVFTQFKQTLDWLRVALPERGFDFRTLTGDMSQSQREEALLAFRDSPPTTIFLLSIRAGAVRQLGSGSIFFSFLIGVCCTLSMCVCACLNSS